MIDTYNYTTTIKNVILVIVAAVILNCASNVLNQITDVKADSINKSHRAIPSSRVSIYNASVTSLMLFIVSLALSWHIKPSSLSSMNDNKSILKEHQTFVIFFLAAFITASYSLPVLGRLKANAVTASLGISIARGLLLSTAGSTAILDVLSCDHEFVEAWVLGGILALYLFGASVTKDFSDVAGDKTDGCFTFPVLYGVRQTVRIYLHSSCFRGLFYS